ncbi:peptidylprolyl isomerase [Paenibacillus sacheonensis]|uniref:Peptidylprolyl isomerase n=1 Tax=Paenibacillus sacheonensis TaxID=742054 RepID=A0A7X5C5L3_9BACL|nr:peptidylprolyl isomerase [Paenibacillus sacheonensis]MBM7569292.1 foldase protein PrsA [Paenibacillus sacheonensis]NBC73504.1 hypothetical protein [Paenibacillus sacheonensis]
MNKDRVLKRIVMLQALCLILLALIVVYRVLLPPRAEPQLPPEGAQDHNSAAPPAGSPAEAPGSIAAKVGDEQITVKELNDQLRLQYGEDVLRTLMVRAAIRMEALAYGLEAASGEVDRELAASMAGYDSEQQYFDTMKEQLGLTPAEIRDDAKYRLLLQKIAVRLTPVSEAEEDAYIADNEQEFAPHAQLRVSWIVTATQKDAEEVLGMLADGQDFAMLARTYSDDEDTASSGGDLGYIDSDDPIVDQHMLEAAKRLGVGETTGPVEVDQGQAVLLLTGKKTDEQLDQQQRHDKAQREIAVSKMNGERAIEDRLLVKYNAVVMP